MNRRYTDRPHPARRIRWVLIWAIVCGLAYAACLTMCAYNGVKSLATTIEAREVVMTECSGPGYARADFWTAKVYKQERC